MSLSVSELAIAVSASGSHFFDSDTMEFFGDTLTNYTVGSPITIVTRSGDRLAYPLERIRPVKNGLRSTSYFAVDNFARVHPATDESADRLFDVELDSLAVGFSVWGRVTKTQWSITLTRGAYSFECDYFNGSGEHAPIPTTRDILICLQLDSSVGGLTRKECESEYGDTIDWDTWEKCREIRANMEKLLGDEFEAFMGSELDR